MLASALTSCFLLEHTWVDATCTTPKTCSGCGATEGEPLGHTEEIVAGKAATCTEAGITDGKKCSVCDEILVAQEEIPALDHTEETVAGKEASCTETGLTEGKKCGVCGEVLVAQEEIPVTNHKDTDADYKCDDCKTDLCTEHSPAEAVKEDEIAATCTKEGSYKSVVKCLICGCELSRETVTVPTIDHTEETVAGKAANCTEAGLTEGKKCGVCGEVLVAQEEIPALDHTEETVAGKAASCTETGLTEGKKCEVCGEILVAQEEIPATGHTFTDGVCACGLIANVLSKKNIIASSDAAGNIYSATYGYNKINDGDLASRYSSKQNGGKVEATIDLGAVYDLSEFKVLLYDYNKSAFNQFGTGFEIEVLFGGEWTKVINCAAEDFKVVVTGDQNWLTFDLGGVPARQVKFTIPSHGSAGWSTFWEIECSAKASTAVEPEPEEPVLVDNVFAGKAFTPTDNALASVLVAGWWKGSGYEGLTDGIKDADNAPGRFSTAMATSGMMDATIDLGGTYELHSLKFYTYDPAAGTTAGSLGANLLIQVYANGEWTDVVTCADNASVYGYLVVNEGTYNDYLEFDLGGISAEKVRFVISASASASGTTYEEIECSGYSKA